MADNPKLAASPNVIGALLLGILGATPAHAAWEAVPDISISAHSDKNPRFDEGDNNESSTSTHLDAAVNLANFTQRGFLTFEPRVSAYRYTDSTDSDLEDEDLYFAGSGRRVWQTVTAGFNARYQRERLLTAEFAEIDSDNDPLTEDPADVDTGRLLFISQDRERTRLSPYLAFQVSERNTLQFNLTDTEVSYSGGNLPGRTAYDDTVLSASIIRTVDARNSLAAVLTVDRYEAAVNQNFTDTVTVEGSFTRPLTELWSFTLGAGVLRSDFEFLDTQRRPTERATTDFTLRTGFRKRALRSNINIDFTRNVYPSSTGFSAVRREIRMFMTQAITERVGASFGLLVNETTALGEVNEFDNRDYLRAELGIEWALKPVLFLNAGYGYTTQDFTFVGGQDATSQAIQVGVTYRGRSRR